MNHTIVLIDDNFSIRQIVKIFLARLSRKYALDLKVFTSDNGVEGLGFVFITSPHLVIIDTTLPKYSGREVLDFLIHNPKFHSDETQVIVLHEGNQKNLNLPKNFSVINKNDKDSFKYFSELVFNILDISDPSPSNDLFNKLSRFVLKNSNQDDLLNKSLEQEPLFKRFFLRFKWTWLELSTSIILTLIILLYGKADDENITQQDIDKRAFRTKYYPTLVVTFISLTIIFINLGLFFTSQISLLSDVQLHSRALTTFTVDSTADTADFSIGDGFCDTDDSVGDGPCTLRAAIQEGNATVDDVTINFNIPGTGVHTLTPSISYPTITRSVTIDGSTEPGTDCSTSTVTILIDGQNVAGSNGFTVESTQVIIKGFSIVGFSEAGGTAIDLHPGSSVTALCNLLGLEIDGTTVNGNTTGISINSAATAQIGNGTSLGRNIISGNSAQGILVSSNVSSVVISGNFIGTDKTGELSKANAKGITVGSAYSGIVIGGSNNLSPGTACAGDCNLISGNTIVAIDITGFSATNIEGSLSIRGNFIGTNLSGTSEIPNASGVSLSYADNITIGGDTIAERNLISGNNGAAIVTSANNALPGEAITNLDIKNNYIGLNASGTNKIANEYGIVMYEYMPDAIIDGNIISGNDANGIWTSFDYEKEPSDSLTVINNKIGTKPDGSGLLGNTEIGIDLLGKGEVKIGAQGQGNIIKNSSYGVKVNEAPGVDIPESQHSNITATISYNTISDNSEDGILLYNGWAQINNNTLGNNGGWGINYIWGGEADILENLIFGSPGILLPTPLNPSGANISKNLATYYPAIRLGQYGNFNDLNDTDVGENNLQNYPVLNSATTGGGNTNIFGTFNSEPNTYYRIEAFAFEQPPLTQPTTNSYIGSIIILTDGSGNYNFATTPIVIPGLPMNPFYNITTTATKCNDSSCSDPVETSEPSNGVIKQTLTDSSTPTPTLTLSPTQIPSPTLTNTPVPTLTNTPIPSVTITIANTPVPLASSTTAPAVVSSPTPSIFLSLAGTRTPVPTASDTPTVTPSEGFVTADSTPIPTITPVPTFDIPIITNVPSSSSYVPPKESVVNLPVVKSMSLALANSVQDVPVLGSLLDNAIEFSGRIKPLTDNLSYLLSLQFIGSSVATSGVTAINLLALTAPAIASTFAQPKLFYYALAWFWKRKSKLPWGIISDKFSHAPVAFARVTLVKDGQRIDSQTTDLQGKYGFIADKGNYQIFITHPDYTDFSQEISVKYDGQSLAQDFELNSKAEQDFGSSLTWVFYQSRKFIKQNLFVLNTIIFSTGFVYTVFAVANSLTIFNYIILSLYLLQIVLIMVFYFTASKKWGQVLDVSTGEVIPGAIVRLLNNERQLDVTITDLQGRYNFILEPGEYYLKVSAPGYMFPTDDTPNVVVNQVGEKLMSFSVEKTERLNIKLYMQRFSNIHVNRNSILSPFN